MEAKLLPFVIKNGGKRAKTVRPLPDVNLSPAHSNFPDGAIIKANEYPKPLLNFVKFSVCNYKPLNEIVFTTGTFLLTALYSKNVSYRLKFYSTSLLNQK